MSELFAIIRDGVGSRSTVHLDGNPTIIKDLPPQTYDLFHNDVLIARGLGPNGIPGFLLHYCTGLKAKEYTFQGSSVYEWVSNLEILAKTPE